MACDQIIDSYDGSSEEGADIGEIGDYIGQAFTMGGTSRDICLAKFNVDVINAGGTSIDVAAKIYACTGTVGIDGRPTGAALATSSSVQFTSTGTTWTDFVFGTPYTLNASTDYCVVLEVTAVVGSMVIGPTADSTSPTHGGNGFIYAMGFGPFPDSGIDTNFYIYYEAVIGWTGIINGITNPVRINGIAVADIAKVNGI